MTVSLPYVQISRSREAHLQAIFGHAQCDALSDYNGG